MATDEQEIATIFDEPAEDEMEPEDSVMGSKAQEGGE